MSGFKKYFYLAFQTQSHLNHVAGILIFAGNVTENRNRFHFTNVFTSSYLFFVSQHNTKTSHLYEFSQFTFLPILFLPHEFGFLINLHVLSISTFDLCNSSVYRQHFIICFYIFMLCL